MRLIDQSPEENGKGGIAENTNGLLRQYLPKGQTICLFSQQQLDEIAWTLNIKPRKPLADAPQNSSSPLAFEFVQHWSDKITPVALEP
jgi:hypothetical protein